MRVLKAASWAAVVALLCSLLVVSASTGASAHSEHRASPGPSRATEARRASRSRAPTPTSQERCSRE